MRQDRASGSTFGLLGAMVLMVMTASFTYAMTASPPTTRLEELSLQSEADLLGIRLLSTPPATRDWTSVPDALASFGLGSPTHPDRMDTARLALLARGELDARQNGAPDYADVKSVLGATSDFHLRITPVRPPLGDDGWTALPLRVAYFGHYSGARAAVSAATSVSATPESVNVSVALTNQAALPAIFTATIALGDLSTGKVLVSHDRHTTLLASGETQRVWVEVPALASWSKIDAVRVTIADPYGNAAADPTGAPVSTAWMPVTMPTQRPAPYALVLQAANPYYVSGADVNFDLDAHDGRGADVDASARFVLQAPDGSERVNTTLALAKGASRTWTCVDCASVGNYTAKLLDASDRVVALDRVHVSQARMFTEKRTPDAVATNEIALIDALVASFDTTRFDAASGAGDVFGDDVNGPTQMPTVLSRYDVVVVGSDVSHHALAPADVKRALTAWVDDGGTLLVLGTSQQPSRWLQSTYGLSIGQATGVATAPFPAHAILTAPEPLRYGSYLHRDRAWQLPADAPFEHVLTLGGTSDGGSRDTLAASRPGAFGDGRVIVTSYLPGALTGPHDAAEASRLVHNLLARASAVPDIAFGPPVPDDVPVAATTRVLLAVEASGGAITPVRVSVHVFRT